ncbi:MAG TPA: hypothetical protein HA282_05320 [Nanoarchaeota archaeon]|nr:MAG: hypothetical protein QT01_C0001G0165 [archaeon GW2011_AR6]HIH17591.1 hypothetical protein [Nanoarchaeota archaeon]HIH33882.1 hypothetical protein [Nanoarchaeota archaeon]HIH51086.1 hypothetical protein [Nanoarchaeota archaeon]HIH66602.1 hypothetical protein [Nanoarchaeota archaeon]
MGYPNREQAVIKNSTKGLKEIVCGIGLIGIGTLGIYGQGVYGSRYGDYYGATYVRMREIDGEIRKFKEEVTKASIEDIVNNEGKLDKIRILVAEKKKILDDPQKAGELSGAEKKVWRDMYRFAGLLVLSVAGGIGGYECLALGLRKRGGKD